MASILKIPRHFKKKRNSEENIWEIIYLWNKNIGKINREPPAVCCCMLFEGRPAGCLSRCMTPSSCLGQIRPKLCSNLLKSLNNGKLFPLSHSNFEAGGEVAYEVPRCGSPTVANKHCAVSKTSTHFGDLGSFKVDVLRMLVSMWGSSALCLLSFYSLLLHSFLCSYFCLSISPDNLFFSF